MDTLTVRRLMAPIAVASLVTALALQATAGAAAGKNVVDCGSDPGALVAAVAAARSGATLRVSGACGGPVVIDRDLIIKAAADTWSMPSGGGLPQVRSAAGSAVRISDVVIRGGSILNEGDLTLLRSTVRRADGWGIFNSGTLEVRESEVSDNGGGILNDGSLVVRHSILAGNHVIGLGTSIAGIRNRGDALIVDTLLERNGPGGGISNSGSLTVRDSTVTYSWQTGIWNLAEGNATVVRTAIVDGNGPDGGGPGGGIINRGILYLRDCTVSGNLASRGAGIWNTGSLTGRGVIITGNNTDRYGGPDDHFGGGILNEGALDLRHSSVTGNTAGSDGGGIFNTSTEITLKDVAIEGNTPNDCTGC